MESCKDKFLTLLYNDLLKVDLADLDFGFYRILKYRREEVKAFFGQRLPEILAEAMQGQAADRATQVRNRLKSLTDSLETVAPTLGLAGAFTDGRLDDRLTGLPAGQDYLALIEEQQRLEAAAGFTQSEEERLYNHLYLFFSRYYADGDFISQPRRGRDGRYSVAYNGEDVHFHWRGRGGHYVKTTEELRSYRYRDGDWSVEFELADATEEQNNVKGKTRYFFPLADRFEVDQAARSARLPFVFRPLNSKEETQWKGNGPIQDQIVELAVPQLRKRLKPGLDGDRLAHHVRRYTRKHRIDYFVHPALGAFLKAELDWYLKNEFLDVEAFTDPEGMTDKFIKFHALRKIGGLIIDFLDQVETFQAALFEKRKFVLRTDYLAPVRMLDPALWPEIVKCPAQIAAWRDLFGLKGRITVETLKTHPTLVVDTRHFDDGFKLRLLACYPDRDEALDGVLVHAENYAALRTLEYRYRGRVKCIYIDPPYNTGSDDFLYKDDFSKHSTWLVMMEERLKCALPLLESSGVFFCSLDDGETPSFLQMTRGMERLHRLGSFVWKTRNTDNRISTRFSTDHDYVHVFAIDLNGSLLGRVIDRSSFKNPDEDKRGVYTTDPLTGKANAVDRPNLHYTITNPDTGDEYPPHPDFGWITDEDGYKFLLADRRIFWPADPTTGKPRKKRFLFEASHRSPVSSLGISIKQGEGNIDLSNLFGGKPSNFPKPVSVVQRLVDFAAGDGSTVVDFFAGTGTTAESVISLNRDFGGIRRFILCEMGAHFESILFPRVMKVMFSPRWDMGRPADDVDFIGDWVERSPRLVKVLRLESFEDSLNALELPEERDARLAGQQEIFGDDYLLKYMLDFETEDSRVRLNTQALERPFDYRLRIHGNDGLIEVPVDLVETFNLLMGLHVQRIHALADGKRPYRVVEALEDGRPVLVAWRDLPGFDPERDRAFLEGRFDLPSFAVVYVNGDSSIPNGRSLDGEFHRRMNERDEHFLQ